MRISVLQGEKVIATQASDQDGLYVFDQLPQETSLSLRFELPGYLRNPTVKTFEIGQKSLILDVFLLKQKDSSALVAARLRERFARKGADHKEEMEILGEFGLGEPDLNAIMDRAASLGTPGLSLIERPRQPLMEEKERIALDRTATPRRGDFFKKRRAEREKEIAEMCVKERAWIAYFQNDEGELAPVRDTLDTQNDEDWIGLRFTDYHEPHIRLGVFNVINKSTEPEGKLAGKISEIENILTLALHNTKRFDIIEQKRVEDIVRQHSERHTLEPSPTSVINVGKVLGVQYMVYGTINEWNPERASRRMGPVGAFGAGKSETEVAMTFNLVDVTNGQILFTTSERVRLGEWAFGFGAPSVDHERLGMVSHAIQALSNKAAFKIATFLRDRKWKGSVVDIKGKNIYINAGSHQGMVPQSMLLVQSVEGYIKDPESGTILSEDLRSIGTLEITAVYSGFSVARVVEGCEKIKKGDRVELATELAPLQTNPQCKALVPLE